MRGACALALLGPVQSCASNGDRTAQGDCFPDSAPLCGQECSNTCGGGCLPCISQSPPSCSNGVVLRCAGDCVEVVETCADRDACVGSTCAKSASDCDAVRAAYDAELTATSAPVVAVVRVGAGSLAPGEYGPGCPDDCAVVPGDCNVGLSTCWLVGWRTTEVQRLAALYARLGCPQASECSCPALTNTISCQGISSPTGEYLHNACVVADD